MSGETSQLYSDFNPSRLSTISNASEFFGLSATEIAPHMDAYDALPLEVKTILEDEWDYPRNPRQGETRLHVTHGPEVISFLRNERYADAADTKKVYESALTLCARVLIATRISIRKQTDLPDGVSIDLSQLIGQMKRDVGIEHVSDIVITSREPGHVEAIFSPKILIDTRAFEQTTFNELPGKNIVVIGIGGGSDGCQAAQEALCMERAGKTVNGVFDVRRIKDCTPEKIEQLDRAIQQQRAGERIGTPNAWRITHEVTGIESLFGSGRFMTHVPASDVPMYLILDNVDGTDTADTLKAALSHVGDVDAVYAADTGGDALFPLHAGDDLGISHTTPDQDAAVLQALFRVSQESDGSIFFGSTVIAAGIDTPDDAQARLAQADALYLPVADGDAASILQIYEDWDMTGNNPLLFGVTPYVFQKSLHGNNGVQVLPIPRKNILNKANPWSPFRVVLPGMNGIFVMSLERHMAAIN